MAGQENRLEGTISREVEVRRLRAPEWREYRSLRLRSLKLDPLAFGSTYERESAYSDEKWIERVAKSATSDTNSLFVACYSSRFVGTSGIYHSECVFHSEGEFNLYGVWLEPDFRGYHIGSRLVDTAISWVRSNHRSGVIILGVNPSQAHAVELYRSRKFVPTGKVEQLEHSPGSFVIEMRLELAYRKPKLNTARSQC